MSTPGTPFAVQITDASFDAPHPNRELLYDVDYDPVARCAIVQAVDGEARAYVGDWIVVEGDGKMRVVKAGDWPPRH